jgi:drug/metabolite transporter (DMT)-like permease
MLGFGRGINVKISITIILSAFAIVAFAGNSILTRFGLVGSDVSPAMFTGLRLISGAIALQMLAAMRGHKSLPQKSDATGIVALFVYAITFTYAYVEMGAAAGALILFGVVQITLTCLTILRGQRPPVRDLIGMALAVAGLAWLLLPKASAPPLAAALLMGIAGIAWGIYTLHGRGSVNAVARTTRNFTGAALLAIIWLTFTSPAWPNQAGLLLAVSSGIITSALGYVIWYTVLPRISIFTAGALQMLVPVVASVGGLILDEPLPPQLLMATLLVLAGIALTLKPHGN